MIENYDFLCGNDFTRVKIALANDSYHTIRVQAELAKAIDFSGGLRELDEIIIDRCPKFTQLLWPENAQNIKRLRIGNSSSLTHLDLSSLSNLEELSIINCKKLIKISGLGKYLRIINIQECPIDQLDLSSNKEINKIILTTKNSNLKVNCRNCDSLQSAIIHVSKSADNDKENEWHKENFKKSEFLFSACTNLNRLEIIAEHTPVDVDTSGCSSLTTSLFSFEENTKTPGEQASNQPENIIDLAKKTAELKSYLILNKKNALKISQHADDVETIIQENGSIGRKNRACLVKLQLLMRAKKNNSVYHQDEHIIEHSNIGIETSSANYPNSHPYRKNSVSLHEVDSLLKNYPKFQNKKHLLRQLNVFIKDFQTELSLTSSLDYPMINDAMLHSNMEHSKVHIFERPEVISPLPSVKENNKIIPNANTKKPLDKKHYPYIRHPFSYFLNTKNHIPLAKKDYLKRDEVKLSYAPSPQLSSKVNIALDKYNPWYGMKTREQLISQNELVGAEKTNNAGTSNVTEHQLATYEDPESNCSTLDKRKKAYGLINVGKVRAPESPLEVEATLINCDDFESNLSAFDERIESSNLVNANKAKVDPAPATKSELATNDVQDPNLSVFKLRKDMQFQQNLTATKKIKQEANVLIAEPTLSTYEYQNSNLSILDIRDTSTPHDHLSWVDKLSSELESLHSEQAITAHKNDDSILDSFKISSSEHSEADFEYHVARALVDLVDPRTLVDSIEDVQAEFNSRLMSSLKNLSLYSHPSDLIEVEKVKAETKSLIAAPQLASYENETTSLSLLEIIETFDDSATPIGVEKVGLEAAEQVSSDGREYCSNAVSSEIEHSSMEEIEFKFHVARALVDLKPLDTDYFSDDFVSACIYDLNEKLLKKVKDFSPKSIPEVLSSASKTIAHSEYLKVEPQLTSYEENESFLLAFEFRDEFNLQENAEPEYLFDELEPFYSTEDGDFDYREILSDNPETWDDSRGDDLYSFESEDSFDGLETGLFFDADTADYRNNANEDQLEQLKALLIECDLLDEVMSDESGTLLQYMLDKLRATQSKDPHEDVELDNTETWEDNGGDGLYSIEPGYAIDEQETDALFDVDAADCRDNTNEDELEQLKALLIECDLLDEVMSDESGTLLQYMLDKLRASQSEERHADVELDNAETWEDKESNDLYSLESAYTLDELDYPETWESERDYELYRDEPEYFVDDDKETDLYLAVEDYLHQEDTPENEFESTDFLDSSPLIVDKPMSDEMLELLDSLTDEEKELLFPSGAYSANDSDFFETLEQLSRKPEIEINLKCVVQENKKRLLHFFDSQKELGIKAWQKDKIYTFADGAEFTFKNDVFQRQRKEGREGLRYEAVSDKQLGEGAFGKVRRIKGTIALDTEQEIIHFKKHGKDGKRRVVKIQQHGEFVNPFASYQKGFIFAKQIAHLAIKEPTLVDNSLASQTSYTVMDEIPGRELFDTSSDDYDGIDILSTDERIELTTSLLFALKEQVCDKGLIHRDIKPENIMVDLGPPIAVNIIDYDLSIEIADGNFAGTEGYYAPEVASAPMSTSAKSDVFSLGRVIALIWRVDLSTYYGENYSYTPAHYTQGEMLSGLFNGIDDLSEHEQLNIEQLLMGMLAIDPHQRFSIDEALCHFATLGQALLPDEATTGFTNVETSDDNFRFFQYSGPKRTVSLSAHTQPENTPVQIRARTIHK